MGSEMTDHVFSDGARPLHKPYHDKWGAKNFLCDCDGQIRRYSVWEDGDVSVDGVKSGVTYGPKEIDYKAVVDSLARLNGGHRCDSYSWMWDRLDEYGLLDSDGKYIGGGD